MDVQLEHSVVFAARLASTPSGNLQSWTTALSQGARQQQHNNHLSQQQADLSACMQKHFVQYTECMLYSFNQPTHPPIHTGKVRGRK
jgi:hypothetical protein